MKRERFRRMAVWCAASVLAAAVWALTASAQQSPATNGDIRSLHIRKNIYMLVGAGANITLQAGDEGVLLVDSGFDEFVPKVMAAVRKVSSLPVRFIINTGVDPDHTLGNVSLVASGVRSPQPRPIGAPGLAAIVAHENVMTRMTAPPPGTPAVRADGWPTDAYFGETRDFHFNGEPIQIFHERNAHTDGDSIVFFRYSDVISAGDVFLTTGYPVIDLQRGGTMQGILDALNHIIDLAVPEDKEEGGTMIVPGHGRLCDEADVVEYRDMLTIIRDRIQDSIQKGMNLEQTKASRPSRDYDRRYGNSAAANNGKPWTADMFVEAAYKTMGGK
jgi:cyclase